MQNGQDERTEKIDDWSADNGNHPERAAQHLIIVEVGNFIEALDIAAGSFDFKSAHPFGSKVFAL